MAVANNSLIVSSSCHYNYNCRAVNVYCYSNSSLSNVGYYVFPNRVRKCSTSDYYDYQVNKLTLQFTLVTLCQVLLISGVYLHVKCQIQKEVL